VGEAQYPVPLMFFIVWIWRWWAGKSALGTTSREDAAAADRAVRSVRRAASRNLV
jgi:hypothetical protein